MADNITTTVEVDPAIATTYQRALLRPNYPQYIYNRFAKKYSIAARSGNTMKFRRYNRYSAATTPITEGITPNGHKQSKIDLEAEISQYGDFCTITDVVDLTTEDKNVAVEVELQADQMNATYDQITRDILTGSASSTTCSNGEDTATFLNATDIKGVRQTMREQKARYMTALIKASQGQGTAPVRPSYWGMADTDLESDIEDVSGFRSTTNYPGNQSVDPMEWGYTCNIRWLTSTEGYVTGGTYSCVILGQDAYATINLSSGNAKSIIHGPTDPLEQRTTIGWKMWHVARILQDLYVHVLKCTSAY